MNLLKERSEKTFIFSGYGGVIQHKIKFLQQIKIFYMFMEAIFQITKGAQQIIII